MSSRRNAENLTPAAARVVARTSRFGEWGVERRLREQLVAAGLAIVEQHGRETKTRLTEQGKACRKLYRHAGLHKTEWPKLTDEERQEWLVALGDVSSAAAAVVMMMV